MMFRKGRINKEVVIAVFIDVEKAYDMLCKEGLVIKLKNMGIRGRIYILGLGFIIWEMNSGTVYAVKNRTPQGSVCSLPL